MCLLLTDAATDRVSSKVRDVANRLDCEPEATEVLLCSRAAGKVTANSDDRGDWRVCVRGGRRD